MPETQITQPQNTKPTYTINIQNYRNIKQISLPLYQGITVLTGKSNAGKSSIINATRGLLYNQIRKSDIRQSSTTPCIVQLANQTSTIKFTLTQSKNQYDINSPSITTCLQKNGTSTPPEINQAFRTDPIYNFQNQMQPPFLVYSSPQELYQQLNTNQTTEHLQSILQQIKQDQKQTKQQVDTNTTLNQQLQNQQLQISQKLHIINQIPPINPQLPNNFQVYQSLQQLINTKSQLLQQITHLTNYPHSTLQFTTPTDQFTSLNQFTQISQQISHLQNQLQTIHTQTEQYSNLLKHFTTCPLCNQPLDNHS